MAVEYGATRLAQLARYIQGVSLGNVISRAHRPKLRSAGEAQVIKDAA